MVNILTVSEWRRMFMELSVIVHDCTCKPCGPHNTSLILFFITCPTYSAKISVEQKSLSTHYLHCLFKQNGFHGISTEFILYPNLNQYYSIDYLYFIISCLGGSTIKWIFELACLSGVCDSLKYFLHLKYLSSRQFSKYCVSLVHLLIL